MNRIMRIFLLLLCVMAMDFMPAVAAQRQWEEVTHLPSQPVEHGGDSDDISVYTADGYVYITVRQTSPVKLFTILGQLIVQQNLRPGTYRFRLANRGIYLLKTDTVTRRLTL